MKRFLIAAAFAAAIPWSAGAQVEKQVEVTKAFVPSLENAAKIPVAPDMTDTSRMRPEIDYTITPLSLQTSLQTRPIRPAQVTYWEFNRPLPFYLKVGAGYPLNSVLDFYASSQNPGTGYVVGYVNHEGRYADIRNNIGQENNSVRMFNRAGAAAGKYFGRHVLEGDLSYENRMYHRYGIHMPAGGASDGMPKPGAQVDYGDANFAVRFGDDFKDMSRTNFDVAVRAGFFFDHSVRPDYSDRARQTTLAAVARIGRGFGRHRLSFEAGYERFAGQKAISDYTEQLIHAGVRYGLEGGSVRLEAGADYYFDKIAGQKNRSYVIPFARLDFNLGTPGLRPFIELDGGVYENSYRSLTRQNPYVRNPWLLGKSSVDYNGRFGIGGSLWRGKMNYRVYGAFSIRDNHLYWLHCTMLPGEDIPLNIDAIYSGGFIPVQARQTVTSINGEAEYRPVASLLMSLGVHGYIYNDDTKYANGAPSFEGNFGVRYQGRKIAFGVSVWLQSSRSWSTLSRMVGASAPEVRLSSVRVPFGTDLRVNFDWKVSTRVTLFAEGRNLANRPLYRFADYPEYGANFTIGAKMNF